MRRILSAVAHRTAGAVGFDLVRRPEGHVWGRDPFVDQVQLLAGTDVRVVFDIGANTGQTSATYRRNFPSADIHAFEPFPDTFEQLRRAHTDSPRFHPHRLAVADAAGSRTFHVNQSHYTNSLLPPAADAARVVGPGLMEAVREVQVDTVRLDDFCQEHGIGRIDVLKMDVQGGEGMVLAGAAGLLAARAIRLVYSEVLLAPMYTGQAALWDVQQLLAGTGYRLFGIYNLVHAGREGVAWADVIYLPPGPSPA